jgi:hypothetical protein
MIFMVARKDAPFGRAAKRGFAQSSFEKGHLPGCFCREQKIIAQRKLEVSLELLADPVRPLSGHSASVRIP